MNPLLKFFEITGGGANGVVPTGPDFGIGVSVILGPLTVRGCPTCDHKQVLVRGDYGNALATIIGNHATFFPDFIGGVGNLLISQRVRDTLRNHGFRGIVAHEASIGVEAECALYGQPIPKYYLVEVTGHVDIDRGRFDNFEGSLCERCKHWAPSPGSKFRWGEKVKIPLPETWNGSVILRVGNISMGPVYCTKPVVDLACANRWTGFGIKAFTWGAPSFSPINLQDPEWFEKLAVRVAAVFPDLS